MSHKSRAGWISMGGMAVGLALILICLSQTMKTGSTRYWPLLVAGLLIGFVSTPFYYYFKARDKQASNQYEVAAQALAKAGERPKIEAKARKVN